MDVLLLRLEPRGQLGSRTLRSVCASGLPNYLSAGDNGSCCVESSFVQSGLLHGERSGCLGSGDGTTAWRRVHARGESAYGRQDFIDDPVHAPTVAQHSQQQEGRDRVARKDGALPFQRIRVLLPPRVTRSLSTARMIRSASGAGSTDESIKAAPYS